MTTRKPDPNQEAARIVRATGAREDATSVDLDAAWAAWEARIQTSDERTRTLLRAAFEAGYEAAKNNADRG